MAPELRVFDRHFLKCSLYVNRRGAKFSGLLPESEALPVGNRNLTQGEVPQVSGGSCMGDFQRELYPLLWEHICGRVGKVSSFPCPQNSPLSQCVPYPASWGWWSLPTKLGNILLINKVHCIAGTWKNMYKKDLAKCCGLKDSISPNCPLTNTKKNETRNQLAGIWAHFSGKDCARWQRQQSKILRALGFFWTFSIFTINRPIMAVCESRVIGLY